MNDEAAFSTNHQMSDSWNHAEAETIRLHGLRPNDNEIAWSVMVFVVSIFAEMFVLLFILDHDVFTIAGLIAMLTAGGYYFWRRQEIRGWDREFHRQLSKTKEHRNE